MTDLDALKVVLSAAKVLNETLGALAPSQEAVLFNARAKVQVLIDTVEKADGTSMAWDTLTEHGIFSYVNDDLPSFREWIDEVEDTGVSNNDASDDEICAGMADAASGINLSDLEWSFVDGVRDAHRRAAIEFICGQRQKALSTDANKPE